MAPSLILLLFSSLGHGILLNFHHIDSLNLRRDRLDLLTEFCDIVRLIRIRPDLDISKRGEVVLMWNLKVDNLKLAWRVDNGIEDNVKCATIEQVTRSFVIGLGSVIDRGLSADGLNRGEGIRVFKLSDRGRGLLSGSTQLGWDLYRVRV